MAVTHFEPPSTRIDVPLSAFGEPVGVEPTPLVQVEGSAGIPETLANHTLSGGGSSATGGLMSVTTGTTVGAWSELASTRILRYRPGQGSRARLTAVFTAGVAGSVQVAGCLGGCNAYAFGYNGTSFGILHRRAGVFEVRTLTVTVGAGGSETATVTLNGVAANVSLTVGSTTLAAVQLAAGTYPGWHAEAVGATVVFVSNLPVSAPLTGTYSLTSTGTAAGTWARTTAGIAPSDDWTAQASWSVDRMDGTGPSSMSLDPTKGNLYEISYPHLGYGTVKFSIYEPESARWYLVHQVKRANSSTTPTVTNPHFRVGIGAYSVSSSTDLTVSSASMYGAVDGKVLPLTNPRGRVATLASVGVTELPVLSIKVSHRLGSTGHTSEILPKIVRVAVDGAKPCRARLLLNPTLAGAPAWTAVDATYSAALTDVAASGVSGGRVLATAALAGGDNAVIDLGALGRVNLQHGDVLTIAALVTGGAGGDVTASIVWTED